MNAIKIFFAGDFCSKPSTSRIVVSDELRDMIQSCDFKVVNFEVPLKPPGIVLPPQKWERFFQHDDTPDFLKGLGFNLFQLANNHAFDWGEEGFKKTKSTLGDATFGAGTYDEAYKVKVVEADGMTQVTAYNMLGQQIYESTCNGDVLNIDVSNWSEGIYLMKVQTANGVLSRRVSIVH